MSTGDIEGIAIVRRDGVRIASSLPRNIDTQLVSRVSASVLGSAETLLELSGHPPSPSHVGLQNERGPIIALPSGKNALSIFMLHYYAKKDSLLPSIQKGAEKIGKILS